MVKMSCIMFHFILLSIVIQISRGSLCVSFLNHSKCSNASKWAVNTPYVIATHDFTPPDSPTFNIYYYLNSTLVCQFFHLSSGNCRISRGSSCGTCVNNYTLDSSIVGNVNITDSSLANSGTILTYDLDKPDISGLRLHTFTYSECPLRVGNALAQNNSTPCGYGCTSQFVCLEGFKPNQTRDMSKNYVCSATAEWNPSVPSDLCVPEPATTETTTIPTAPTASNGSTKGDVGPYPNSGLVLAVLGGVLAAICIGLFVYMAITANKSAVIAGIVLGSLSLTGMVFIIACQFLHKKSHKRKGIPGKAVEDPSL